VIREDGALLADRDRLDEALFARAVPVIDAVIRRRCRNWRIAADVPGEVRSEVLLRLLRRTRDRASDPIERLDEYVAAVASRVIDDLVRAALPEWARLKHRVRYVLDHDDRFVMTLSADGRTVCALETATAFNRRRVRSSAADALAKTMLDVMRQLERAPSIDDLVTEVAARCGVADPIHADAVRIVAPRTQEPDAPFQTRQALRALWTEIRELPRRQRLALLLNARDTAGDSVLRLLMESEVMTPGELARAVEVRESDLELLLARLPMRDLAIADCLQLTRQQVINLRSAARDRLARRTSRKR
jgi:hypothetical protein